jgi:hypothetical protein
MIKRTRLRTCCVRAISGLRGSNLRTSTRSNLRSAASFRMRSNSGRRLPVAPDFPCSTSACEDCRQRVHMHESV